MRILYPLLWSRPGRDACQAQSVATAAALARRGHEVTLLMPRGAGDAALDAGALRDWFDVAGDFRLVQRSGGRAGARLGASLMWLRRVFADPLLGEADLLYSRIPAMFGAGLVAPRPFATDHYRPWPDQYPVLRPLLRAAARRPNCLGLVLHSHYAADAWRRAGVPGDRLLVAHNGADPALLAAPVDRTAARAALGLPADRFVAAYAGRIGPHKGLDQLLALADLRPDVLFLLVGEEGETAIGRAARTRANVRVLPWQPPADLPAWLHAADVLLVPPSRAPLERWRSCVLPIKTFAYLAAGRAILAPRSPDTAELLADGETALLVEPDRPAAAAAALDRLRGDPGLAARLGANARRLSEGLTWDARAAKIEAFLEQRLEHRAGKCAAFFGTSDATTRTPDQRSPYSRTLAPSSAPATGAVQAPTAAGK